MLDFIDSNLRREAEEPDITNPAVQWQTGSLHPHPGPGPISKKVLDFGMLSEFHSRDANKKGACLCEMPQESWEISPVATRAAGVRGIWNTL